MRTKKFSTSKCPVFGSELLYFFLLRPAYRTRLGAEESHQISRFPVAFILKNEAVPDPRHVYPFDTGGAASGAFDGQADPLVPLEDYALSPNYEGAQKFIGWAFGSLARYFEAQLDSKLSEKIKPFESVAVSYQDIARLGTEGSNVHDSRSCTIEVAASHNVDVEGSVQLIILPKQFVEGNGRIEIQMERLRRTGCQISLYDWQPNRRPNEFQEDLFRISKAWYSEMRII